MPATNKPTGGEWKVEEYDPDSEPGGDITIEASGAPIACVYGTDNFPCLDPEHDDFAAIHAENWATARVMAAAKDLLAALKAVVAIADRATVEFDAARAAIARAEGTQS